MSELVAYAQIRPCGPGIRWSQRSVAAGRESR